MTQVIAWAKGNRARTAAVVTVLVGFLGPAGVPAFVVAGLLTIVGILIAGPGVHDAVAPVAEVVATVRAATEATAATVATVLGEETIGAAGTLTETGTVIAFDAAALAADAALKDLGVKRKDRAR